MIWYAIKQFSTGCQWNSCTYKVGDITREYDDDCCIPMPTLQMAMKWLREIHGIDIIIEITDLVCKNRKYYCMIYDRDNNSYILDLFNSYEQACDAAIKYCLENLI